MVRLCGEGHRCGGDFGSVDRAVDSGAIEAIAGTIEDGEVAARCFARLTMKSPA